MGFSEAVKSVLGQYAGFSGRARRSEYWWFFLVFILAALAGALVDAIVGTTPLFYVLAALGLIVPMLGVTFRRLHDTGKSGWWVLLGLVPFGGIVLLVFYCADSAADNQYGPSPKQTSAGWGTMT